MKKKTIMICVCAVSAIMLTMLLGEHVDPAANEVAECELATLIGGEICYQTDQQTCNPIVISQCTSGTCKPVAGGEPNQEECSMKDTGGVYYWTAHWDEAKPHLTGATDFGEWEDIACYEQFGCNDLCTWSNLQVKFVCVKGASTQVFWDYHTPTTAGTLTCPST